MLTSDALGNATWQNIPSNIGNWQVVGTNSARGGFNNNIADGNSNTILIGETNNSSAGQYMYGMGWGLELQGFGTSAVGMFNTIPTSIPNAFTLADPIFIVGNGKSKEERSNAMTILKNGNVGIGIINPSKMWQVRKGSSGVTPNGNSQAFLESNTNMYLGFGVPNNNESGILFGRPDKGSASGGIIYTSSKSLVFRTFANTNRMIVDSLGNVGIGTTTTLTKKLEVNGAASITSGLQLTNLSGSGIRPLNVDADGNVLVGSIPSATTTYSKNYNISAAAARKIGTTPDANFIYMATACLAYFSVGTKNTSGQMILPVEFPDDAVLQTMTMSAIDNSDNNLEAILLRVPQAGSPLSQAVVDGVQSTGNNAAVKEYSKAISHTVNNKTNYYYILVQITAGEWQDSNLALRGINFQYSISY